MTLPTPTAIARAICCPSGACQSPERCDVLDRSRSHLVDIHGAAQAVARLLCERWREWPRNGGPMVRERQVEGRDEP